MRMESEGIRFELEPLRDWTEPMISLLDRFDILLIICGKVPEPGDGSLLGGTSLRSEPALWTGNPGSADLPFLN